MDKLELLGEIQTALINYSFYLSIEDDIKRLIGLVQDNQNFFGNPPAGQSCVKLATDKLEKLIEIYKDSELPTGTMAICEACNQEIVYVNPYWQHIGELQPRHPAWPK